MAQVQQVAGDEFFVGAQHRQTHDSLLNLLGQLQRGQRQPNLVLLQGVSGVGKSRIIREFYASCRAGQPEPGYWPILPADADAAAGLNPLANRKRIGPDQSRFSWPAGALPDFAWWTLSCERFQTGDPIAVVSQLEAQLAVHSVALGLSWAGKASRTERFGRAISESWKARLLELLE